VATVTVPPSHIINDINKADGTLFGQGKDRQCQATSVINPKEKGGLGMIDIETKCKCLKLIWLIHLMEGKQKSDAFKLALYYIRNFDKSFNSCQVITT
jgi:hypothetical protein